jgi:hypothetical protein
MIVRNHIVYTLLLALIVTGSISAQEDDRPRLFQGMVSAGLNIAQIDGDGPFGYNYYGLTAGIGTLVRFKPKVSASVELLYTMRGTKLNKGEFYPQPVYTVSMDYIEVPLLLNIHDKNLLIASIGLSPAVLARFNLDYQYYDRDGLPEEIEIPACLSEEPARFDLSGVAGFQFLIRNRLGLGSRYSYSLLGVRPHCEGVTRARSQYHNVITVKATYFL